MNRKICLIYNPASRGGKSENVVTNVREQLDEYGVDYGFLRTEKPLDGITKAQLAAKEGFNTVCSIGGDGTAHEVANGAIKAGLTFSLIPAGSGNDFAMAIGLNGDITEATNVLLEGKEEKVSVVKIGDRYSINIVDSGLGGIIAKHSQTKLKWMTGSKKYTLLTFRSLLTHKKYPTTLRLDGEELEYDINIMAMGFGQTFGSGMIILPQARFNKSEMDIAVIHSASKLKILRLFPTVFSGTHTKFTDHVTMLKGKKLEVIPNDTEREMLSQAEGELIGKAPLKFEAKPQELEVIIPKKWSLDNQSLWASS